VLLVGNPGVGDAIDRTALNCAYFAAAGVRVLGSVFNKLPPDEFDDVRAHVQRYYAERTHAVYGFVPRVDVPPEVDARRAARAPDACRRETPDELALLPGEPDLIERLSAAFAANVDVDRLLADISAHAHTHTL
jgi:hypothetical protein